MINRHVNRIQFSKVSGVALASLLLVSGVGYMTFADQPESKSNPDPAIHHLQQTGRAFASIAKKISPAVVSLKVEKRVSDSSQFGGQNGDQSSPFNDEFFKRFFGDRMPDSMRQRQAPAQKHAVVGQGSGFVVSRDGYILTNHHVVGDASKVTVKFADGSEMPAKVIGSDSHSDVAVIKVDAKNLTILPMGDSDKTEVGEWVLASGAPYGLTQTITAGIVSAVGRNDVHIANYENFIQTDAAINPGNSGGPLVNLDGEVIGINTAIVSRNGGSVGLGFAIPIDMAKQVYEQIITHGSVVRGYLGVSIQALTPELAEQFATKDTHGVIVGEVQKGTPGEKAGLKQADVIVEMDGKKINDATSLRNAISMKSPGSKIKLTVIRDGHRTELAATLEKLPDDSTAASENAEKPAGSWGFSVQPLTPELSKELSKKSRLQVDAGVVINEVTQGSPASEAGLEPGMVVSQVNRKKVTTVEEFDDLVNKNKESKTLLLLVTNGQGARFVVLKLAD